MVVDFMAPRSDDNGDQNKEGNTMAHVPYNSSEHTTFSGTIVRNY